MFIFEKNGITDDDHLILIQNQRCYVVDSIIWESVGLYLRFANLLEVNNDLIKTIRDKHRYQPTYYIDLFNLMAYKYRLNHLQTSYNLFQNETEFMDYHCENWPSEFSKMKKRLLKNDEFLQGIINSFYSEKYGPNDRFDWNETSYNEMQKCCYIMMTIFDLKGSYFCRVDYDKIKQQVEVMYPDINRGWNE